MTMYISRAVLLFAAIAVAAFGVSSACDAACKTACQAAGGLVTQPPAPFLQHCQVLIKVKGGNRRMDVYLPANYNPSMKYKTLVHIHGAFSLKMSVTTMEIYQKQGYAVQASEGIAYWEGYISDNMAPDFIHVYPLSAGSSTKRQIWNAEFWRCSVGFCTNANDVAFLDQMLKDVKSKFSTSHIFATGTSNGGMMLYTMYCKSKYWAKNIKGYVIQNSGIGMKYLKQQCKPPAAVPLLQLHGVLDPVIEMFPTKPVDNVWFAPQHGGSQVLAKLSGCTLKPRQIVLEKVKCDPQYCEKGDAAGMTILKCNEYCAQKPGSIFPTVTLCVIAGGAHAIESPYKGWAPMYSLQWMKRISSKK